MAPPNSPFGLKPGVKKVDNLLAIEESVTVIKLSEVSDTNADN